jgi:hypothetical protein
MYIFHIENCAYLLCEQDDTTHRCLVSQPYLPGEEVRG